MICFLFNKLAKMRVLIAEQAWVHALDFLFHLQRRFVFAQVSMSSKVCFVIYIYTCSIVFCIETTLSNVSLYRIDFTCVNESTSTCIETTLYRNDRVPVELQAYESCYTTEVFHTFIYSVAITKSKREFFWRGVSKISLPRKP